MREIKFRAWYPDADMVGQKCSMQGDATLLEFFQDVDDAKDNNEEKVIFMQFTGLKDKNGKEIYEGDILKIKWHVKDDSANSEWIIEEHIAGVEWSGSGYVIRWGYCSKPFEIDGNKELCFYQDYHHTRSNGSFQKLTDFEVIGNIYENPERRESLTTTEGLGR